MPGAAAGGAVCPVCLLRPKSGETPQLQQPYVRTRGCGRQDRNNGVWRGSVRSSGMICLMYRTVGQHVQPRTNVCFRPIAAIRARWHSRLPMRWVSLFLMMALGGCGGPKNTFVVQDPRGLVGRATLRLCGSETPLVREGQRLSLSRSITCEGDGEIQLVYIDGGPEHCLIGYVTPEAQQNFQFRANQSSCQPLS